MVTGVHYRMTMMSQLLHRRSVWAMPGILLLATGALSAQNLIRSSSPSGPVRIFNTDSAVLESQEARSDLPCKVTPGKAVLGFDLKFHAGYDVTVPLHDLAGSENALTMVFRITPENQKDDPVYFSQRVAVPVIDENSKGDAFLQGVFELGEGKYHVDWLMRDRAERVCSAYWDVEVALPARDKQVLLALAPGTVRAAEKEPFREEPPVEREPREGPLNVKVMVNFAPQDARSATLQPLDMNALVSIIRGIARDPRVGKFSIVAFNSNEQRVIYRQETSARVDFPALGEAINGLKVGTVDVKTLAQKNGETQFLATLINEEVDPLKEHPDAVIFAGPKVAAEGRIPEESLKKVADAELAFFYMNYNLNPQSNPWRDTIGNAVKTLKGLEFTITRPRDLFFAWSEIVGRIVKSKLGRTASNASGR